MAGTRLNGRPPPLQAGSASNVEGSKEFALKSIIFSKHKFQLMIENVFVLCDRSHISSKLDKLILDFVHSQVFIYIFLYVVSCLISFVGFL